MNGALTALTAMAFNSMFEWDEEKNLTNKEKHGVTFQEAQWAFFDNNRVIWEDLGRCSIDNPESTSSPWSLAQRNIALERLGWRRTVAWLPENPGII